MLRGHLRSRSYLTKAVRKPWLSVSRIGWLGALRDGAFPLADQGLISGTNFLVVVLLARGADPAELGMFALIHAGLLFANSMQLALITQPFVFHSASRQGDEFSRYATRAALSQLVLTGLAVAAVTAIAVVWYVVDSSSSRLVFLMVPAIVAWQLQEFTRRIRYVRGHTVSAFANDLIAYGGWAAGVALLWRLDRLTSTSALVMLALAFGVAFVVAMRSLSPQMSLPVAGERFAAFLSESWAFGRWLLGTTLAYWTAAQLFPFLTAVFVSTESTGAIRAAVTLMGPGYVIMQAVDTSYSPKAAKVFRLNGTAGLERIGRRIALLTLPPVIAFSVVVISLPEWFLRTVYGEQFQDYGYLAQATAVSFVFAYIAQLFMVGLRAKGDGVSVFRGYLWSSAFVLTGGVLAVYFAGTEGAAFGIVAQSVILCLALGRRYFRSA